MQKQMPETLNFLRQVERNYRFEGEVALEKMERLSALLLTKSGHAAVYFEFATSVGIAALKGRVKANLEVQCQRCMQPMTIAVNSHFKFALIHSEEEIDELPAEFEPYLLEGDEQLMLPVLEDEILLSLPMVTMHEQACSDFMSEQQAEIQASKEASHPFAALKGLKDAN